ncbi:DUF427 domain-containing protein [Kribbella sandramycini]|uniref:DUF427 domain-containing protein n=1 Tax=Kribbella sandramycini TaxID=60450 RepID=A0A7Y4P0R6_9ACTN|nr:DUF427 domain-containing protein [Kribbella sandramycini]MBB6564462.1 uncharacterized protein (DUF427 family) [Kribbella sandramycini]NOL42168.1 DUF427 domain-containing protein [Kribbella sandramycini]
MADKTRKLPGADHPITIAKNPDRVVVKLGDLVLADTRDALSLQESTYPAVQYLPRANVDFTALERTEHTTYCPYKGDAAYYSIMAAGADGENAVWTYEQPYDAVADIRDHVAFYPNKVTIEIIAD